MKKFFTTIPNRIKAIYLIWVGIHLSLLIFSGNFLLKQSRNTEKFFPSFPWRPRWQDTLWDIRIRVYDITEFIFYLIIPIIIYAFIKLWNKKDAKEPNSN